MTWYYKDSVFESEHIGDYVGFVYLIERLRDGKKYIGKKLFGSKRVLTRGGKKRKVHKESDWKSYFGSNAELVESVQAEGQEGFKRVILYLCNSKGVMSYLELKEQILSDALLREDYFNSFVGGKIHSKHVRELWLANNTLVEQKAR